MGRKLTREQRRQARVRRKLRERAGEDRLRLSVYRSHKYIYAQIIDDAKGHTLVAASSNEPEMRKKLKSTGDTAAAFEVGKLLAERARKAKATKVYFDRGGYLYHGRVKALADGAREGGLDF
jgi:large subunit ribosomal protein L18